MDTLKKNLRKLVENADKPFGSTEEILEMKALLILALLTSCGRSDNPAEKIPNSNLSHKTDLNSGDIAEESIPINQIKIDFAISEDKKTYTVTNHSEGSVWFYGYSHDSVIYNLEGRLSHSDDWFYIGPLYCGVGIKSIKVSKGKSLNFNVGEYLDSNTKEFEFYRLGVHVSNSSNFEETLKFKSKESSRDL